MASLFTKVSLYLQNNSSTWNDQKNNIILQNDNDGKGDYIAKWNLSIPQPTQAQLDALDAQGNIVETNQVAALAQEQINRESALNKLKALGLTDAEITALIG
jgi:hypothetical protein